MELLMDPIVQAFEKRGYRLDIHDKPEPHRQISYWYGGLVATITDISTGDTYDIVANGDVILSYYDENQEQAVYVKDKGNNAIFYNELSHIIQDDEHLNKLIENHYADVFPRLEIYANNWFEVFSNFEEDRNFEEVIDSESYLFALEEALAIIEDYKSDSQQE